MLNVAQQASFSFKVIQTFFKAKSNHHSLGWAVSLNPKKPKFSKLHSWVAYFMTCDLIPCPLPQQEWKGIPLRTNRHYNQTWATWDWRFHKTLHVLSLTLIAGNAWTLTSFAVSLFNWMAAQETLKPLLTDVKEIKLNFLSWAVKNFSSNNVGQGQNSQKQAKLRVFKS